jgi:isoquinoline 1-oxidoreductase subunit alpha
VNLTVNGKLYEVSAEWQDDSLLSYLREALGLVGAKYGCGVGQCGACTVLIDENATRACLIKVKDLSQQKILTIEGLAGQATTGTNAVQLHPVQQAWLRENVSQCGYCQSGQIMATVALLKANPKPNDGQIDAALAGHLCRCGTQQRVRAAIHKVGAL